MMHDVVFLLATLECVKNPEFELLKFGLQTQKYNQQNVPSENHILLKEILKYVTHLILARWVLHSRYVTPCHFFLGCSKGCLLILYLLLQSKQRQLKGGKHVGCHLVNINKCTVPKGTVSHRFWFLPLPLQSARCWGGMMIPTLTQDPFVFNILTNQSSSTPLSKLNFAP